MNVKSILKTLVTLLSLVLIVFVSALVTLKVLTWGKTVEVPELAGKDLAAAVNMLAEKGLEANVERQEHHPVIPANAVIYQDPPPGTRVKKGRGVSVTVSLGSEEVKVPGLKREAMKRAQLFIAKAGLVLGDVSKTSSGRPANEVIAQYPDEGTVLQKGASVDVLVSNGNPPVSFITPDLADKTLGAAQDVTRTMALRLVSGGKGPVIVSQNPLPGYRISAGSPLYVTMGEK